MGWIYRDPLASLVTTFVYDYGLTHFVETGTYLGDAVGWAASMFAFVWSVEVSPEFHQQAVSRFSHLANVEFVLGNSADELERIVPRLTAPALCWLDAHAGGGYFGAEDCCPLLDELTVLKQSPVPHFVLIDDARAFVAPPPPPFDWQRWPSIDEVLGVLQAIHDYYIVIVHDTIIAVPQNAKLTVVDYCQRVRPKI